jgi:diadenosine tetraphosphatase ApaH/serine/threonine PP2A family protein phosphatase
MQRLGIISDIHGNVHALTAVLKRLADEGVSEICCLGDVVGYGPDPVACLDLVLQYCDTCVRGNHDSAAFDPDHAPRFNPTAMRALQWTQEQLQPHHLNALIHMPVTNKPHPEVICVHDTPLLGLSTYIYDQFDAACAFPAVEVPICLVGHTHVPVVFSTPNVPDGDPSEPSSVTMTRLEDGVPVDLPVNMRFICNPGSVGQPRDADPRASFAVLDMDLRTFTMHREPYDIDAVHASTKAAGLPAVLAERLYQGA